MHLQSMARRVVSSIATQRLLGSATNRLRSFCPTTSVFCISVDKGHHGGNSNYGQKAQFPGREVVSLLSFASLAATMSLLGEDAAECRASGEETVTSGMAKLGNPAKVFKDSASLDELRQQYYIGKKVGEGGFAEVFKGVSKQSREVVAIKAICKGASFPDQLVNEINVLKNGGTESTGVTLEALFEDEGHVYVVIPFLEGGPLRAELDSRKCFSEAEARGILKSVATELNSMHKDGYVHFDVKLSNILLTKQKDEGHITDFGLSRKVEEDGLARRRDGSGTPEYWAPEIVIDGKGLAGKAADVWALGCVLFTLITGTHPFTEGGSLPMAEVQRRIKNHEGSWNHPKLLEASKDLQDLLKGMLDPNPGSRLSMRDVLSHRWFQM